MARDLGATHILLVQGRLSQTVTNRPLALQALQFDYEVDGAPVPLPAQITVKPGGYYGVVVSSLGGLPAADPGAAVTLRIRFQTQDGRAQSAERQITGADLAQGAWALPDADPGDAMPTLLNAPFQLDAQVDPAPVMLHGQVLRGNDPTQPAVGARVDLLALSTTCDSRGAFRIGPVPVAATSPLSIQFNGATTNFTLRPDFDAAINFRTFSI